MTNFIRLADKPDIRVRQSTLHVSASQKQPQDQEERFCSDPKFSPAPSAQGRLQQFLQSLQTVLASPLLHRHTHTGHV